MLKEIKEVGGEAGNDSTMEAKAEEGFQRSSTDCLYRGWQARRERSKNSLTMSPLPLSMFSVKVQGIYCCRPSAEKGLLVLGFGFVFL